MFDRLPDFIHLVASFKHMVYQKSNLFSPEKKTTSAAGFRDVSTPIGSMYGMFTDIYHQ